MNRFKGGAILFLKGLAMGSADVIPGVSGGTIAFITGIYEKLIDSLHKIDLEAIKLFFTGKWKTLFERINGSFLITLIAGILTAIITLAKIVEYLLVNEPVFLWSFFLGLILASAWVVGRNIKTWNYKLFFALVIGAVLAYFFTTSRIIHTPNTPLFTFMAGSVAIMAMILPGISGSFLLLIMDKYNFIIGTISSMVDKVKNVISPSTGTRSEALDMLFAGEEFLTIVLFAAGAALGLILFSKLLHWLFKNYHDLMIAVLTGFLIGSLNKVWPWKNVLSYRVDRHGERVPWEIENVLPTNFDLDVFLAILLILTGFLVVFLMEKFAGRQKDIA